MNAQLFGSIPYVILASLIGLNIAIAPFPAAGENDVHFWGLWHTQPDNRRYARTLTNLNVGEPRTVRMIYFLPNDWQYRADVVQQMKDDIRTVQTFYAKQMQAHGYGEATFRFEADSQGEPMVHRVDGQHPFSDYDNTLGKAVFDELEQAFDMRANIYFIVLGTDALRQGNGQPAGGVGYRFSKNGGAMLVPNEFSWEIVAHELGHTFGLNHDMRDGDYIMSYGPGKNRLSQCAADFLAVHSYFNSDIPIEAENPSTIELVSPRWYPPGSMSAAVRLRVHDSDGIHQVLLHALGGLQLCRTFSGEKDAVVEFDYDGGFVTGGGFESFSSSDAHWIRVDTVDTKGNVSDRHFTIAEESPHHIATLEGHVSAVRSVAFSDGGILASGSWDTTVKLWDVEARQNIATFEEHVNGIEFVGFSPSGTLATAAADAGIMLWNVAARQRIAVFGWMYFSGRTNCMSFSPDGRIIARGDSEGVTLWDVPARTYIATLPHGDHVASVSFSRDGILASGSIGGTVKLWNVARREQITTLTHENTVLSVMFSPDGETLATGGWGGIELWNVATESRLDTLTHGATVSSVSFSTDGETLASGGWDGTVKLWDMTTRVSFATFGPTSAVYSVMFSPDGRTIASGTAEGTIELWDVSGLTELRLEGLTEVDIPDPNLRTAIESVLGIAPGGTITAGQMATLTDLGLEVDLLNNSNISNLTGLEYATNLTDLHLSDNTISDISAVEGLTNLTFLGLWSNTISDISALAGLTNLTDLHLSDNAISDVSAVAGLTNLTTLYLGGNAIKDLSPLVANTGLGSGDSVSVENNPLSYTSIKTHIPTLQSRGVELGFNNRTPTTLLNISGNNQRRLPGKTLANPFVVEARDENGSPFAGVSVTFTVTEGGGTLSATSVTTDIKGRAESTLTLGPNPGANTVTVSVTGIQEQQTFYAEGIRTPKAFWIISGFDQKGLIGEALPRPIVVEVRDQSGEPLPDVQVTFAVISGGGTLSVTSVTTDSNGRAMSTLTLGPNPGTNSVEVTVSGIQQSQTATAIAELPPIPEDVNRDDVVNILDLVSVASVLGDEGDELPADVNADGKVNILDLVLVVGALGNAAAPASDPQALAMLTAQHVEECLAQARGLDLTDAPSQQGVLFLEQLLRVLTPKDTALLPNYPNPFNPETWIPYRLAEDSVVTFTIYDGRGRVVRALEIGHQIAAFYETRSKAIYWDGRNESGDQVASGVYFYHLSAGDYSAVRKMLIIK